nr:hypothetical protein [uncultured Roseateles sp.]
MFHFKTIVVLVATMAMVGCGTVPSSVVMPAAVPKNSNADEYLRSMRAQVDTYAEYVGVRPVQRNRDTLIEQLNLFVGTWRKAQSGLLVERDIFDNAQFIGTLAATGLALKNHLSDAKKAAVGTGVLGIVESRYKIETQAANYKQGANAMECVRQKIDEVPPRAWNFFDQETGGFDVNSANAAAIAQIEKLNRLFPDINYRMSKIVRRLRDLQEAVRISSPSVAELKAALIKAANDAVVNTVSASGAAPHLVAKTFQFNSAPATIDAVELAALLSLTSEVDTCVTEIGGA